MPRKDRTVRTHVLEGKTAGGAKVLACGPRVLDNVPTVGRADVLGGRGDAVTCTKCRTVYRLGDRSVA